jgi:AcrR family transcriptional regulator
MAYDGAMSRWEPNAQGRLVEAALELYRERGFDQTTVAEIAARAGLTERTFFRHFADKREVLFSGSEALQALVVDTLAAAHASAAPIDAVAAALEAAGAMIEERTGHDRARLRHAVIGTHAELRERELIKLASIASAIADALRRRGVKDPAAGLAAEAGIAVFKIAFERWVEGNGRRDFAQHLRESIEALRAVTGAKRRREGKAEGGRSTSRARSPSRSKTARGGRASG